jgi:tight adherence protein C
MPSYIILAAVAVSASLPLLFWAVARIGQPQHSAAHNLTRDIGPTNLRDLVLARPASERAVMPLLERLAGLARRLSPVGMLEALDQRIILAGRPDAWPATRVLAVKLILGVSGGLAGLSYITRNFGLFTILMGAGVTVLGFFLPDVLLRIKADRRQQAIRLALPDTLDQMTICVQAGLGFEAALAKAGQSGKGPLADELVRALQEMQIGATRAEALRGLTERTAVPELRQFVVALLQAESYGLPISRVLQAQAEDLRVRRRQRAEERAMKIPVKMVFPLVLFILPSMFIVALGPAVLRIIRFMGSGM